MGPTRRGLWVLLRMGTKKTPSLSLVLVSEASTNGERHPKPCMDFASSVSFHEDAGECHESVPAHSFASPRTNPPSLHRTSDAIYCTFKQIATSRPCGQVVTFVTKTSKFELQNITCLIPKLQEDPDTKSPSQFNFFLFYNSLIP
jgi:hypothetical protein